MQIDSAQTDTLRTDSPAISPSPDTISPDTGSAEIKPDSALTPGKKDSAAPAAEKKMSAKPASSDAALQEKNFPAPPEPASGDSVLAITSPDTAMPAEPMKDTLRAMAEEVKSGDESLAFHSRNVENNSWIIILFLAIFSVLAWIKVGYSKRIRQFFEAFLSNRYIRQLVREEFVFTHPSSIALSAIFLLTASLLLTQANYWFQWNIFTDSPARPGDLLVFLKIFASMTIFYMLKILVIRLSAFLFHVQEELTEYLFNLLLFNNILGMLLLPLVIGAVFATAIPTRGIILFSGGLALAAFLFRLVKCIFIGSLTTKISKSYIILYICTLEILPLFVVIKVFIGKN